MGCVRQASACAGMGPGMNQNAEDDMIYSKRITAVKYFALGTCLAMFVAYGLIVG